MTDEIPRYVSDHPSGTGHTPVYAIDEDGDRRRLDKRLDLVRHSPDGFGWGYGGSGPAQLAIAILADATSDGFAESHYMRFKWDVIAVQPDDEPLRISRSDVDAWVEALDL